MFKIFVYMYKFIQACELLFLHVKLLSYVTCFAALSVVDDTDLVRIFEISDFARDFIHILDKYVCSVCNDE